MKGVTDVQEPTQCAENPGYEVRQLSEELIMQPFIAANELKQNYGVFGHFYSVELTSKEIVECRSVLEIASKTHVPKEHSELSVLRPDAVFIMMNPGSPASFVSMFNVVQTALNRFSGNVASRRSSA